MPWRNPLIPRVAPLDTPPGQIDPVPDDVARPFWSVMIPTIDRPGYLTELLESILAQDPGPDAMQIMVIDNASVADIGALIEQIGGGRVEYFRQAERVPFAENFNTCIRMARGHYIHLMHDDDLVLPGCYDTYRHHIETYDCSVVMSQVIAINQQGDHAGISQPVMVEDGLVKDIGQLLWQKNTFALNTLVAKRDLYEQVGGYRDGMMYGSDFDLCLRLFEIGRVGFLPEPKTMYRVHDQQTSRIYWELDLFRASLPGLRVMLENRDDPLLRHQLYRSVGISAYQVSQILEAEGHYAMALKQALWGFRLNPTWDSLRRMYDIFYAWKLKRPVYLAGYSVRATRRRFKAIREAIR